MINLPIYNEFFEIVLQSISDKTFAKLTLAKTIGNPELQNIYARIIAVEKELKISLTFKVYNDGIIETVKECEISDLQKELLPYIDNPFLKALLFTCNEDVTLKLNKKKVASIVTQPPTFKNANPIFLEL
jgi:hypothetical protein